MAQWRVSHDARVVLPSSYAKRVAATAESDAELGVSRLGSGIVVRGVSATWDIVVGHADRRGQWYRDGGRHVEAPTAEDPVEAMEMGL